ncbi:alpha/beta fold hydrolase [Actinokineospora guangxiensis]|uniref:Alpha/beta fold hydrolase n=1 Tax=Actinokineospora guangxiensis TaxID=1490288 RepID=A0ABW0EU53_9PSEU
MPHVDDDAAASAVGLRVIAPERPGFGLSDPFPGHTVAGWADDAEQLLDHLGVPGVAVVGGSGGGPFAVAVAALLPHRVSALALVASGVPGPALNADELARIERGRLTARGEQVAALVREDPEAFRAATGITPNPWWTAMLVEAFRQGPNGYVEDHLLNATDWSPLLSRVAAPVRAWHGADDDNIRVESVRWMLDRLPGAELTEIEGAGHDIGDHWPQVLRWLRDNAPSSP